LGEIKQTAETRANIEPRDSHAVDYRLQNLKDAEEKASIFC